MNDHELAPPDDLSAAYVFDAHADANAPHAAEYDYTMETAPADDVGWDEIASRLYVPPGGGSLRKNKLALLSQEPSQVSTTEQFPEDGPFSEYADDPSPHYQGGLHVDDRDEQSESGDEERQQVLTSIFSGRPFYSVPPHLRGDKELILAAIRMEGAYCFDYIEPQWLRSEDRDIVMALVGADGTLLETVSEFLCDDMEVVRRALQTSAQSLRFASRRLQQDRTLRSLAAERLKEEKRLEKMYAHKCGPVECAPMPISCAPSRFAPSRFMGR